MLTNAAICFWLQKVASTPPGSWPWRPVVVCWARSRSPQGQNSLSHITQPITESFQGSASIRELADAYPSRVAPGAFEILLRGGRVLRFRGLWSTTTVSVILAIRRRARFSFSLIATAGVERGYGRRCPSAAKAANPRVRRRRTAAGAFDPSRALPTKHTRETAFLHWPRRS